MSDDVLSDLANDGDAAASGSTLYSKAKSSVVSGVEAGAGATAAVGGAAATAIALGATLGSAVPVIGTIIGATVGAIVGLFDFFKKTPNPGIDDAYWDALGGEGFPTHEPSGQDISTAQIALVLKFAQGIASQKNWQFRWPTFWNNIAHGTNPHSSLLADAVARFLGAPEGGKPFNPAQLASVATDGASVVASVLAIANQTSAIAAAAAAKNAQKAGSTVNAINPATGLPYPNTGAVMLASTAKGINPATGLPYPNTGAAITPATAASQAAAHPMNLSNLTVVPVIAGLNMTPIYPGMAVPPGTVVATPAQAAAIAAASPIKVIGSPSITLGQAHQIVSSPTPANQTYIAQTAASADAGHAVGIGNAEVLSIAQRLQVEAKYVQRYLGAAAGQAILQGLHVNGS
jgi:hypothetical protein